MRRFVLFLYCLIAIPSLARAQPNYCETLIQREGVVTIPVQASGRPAVAVLNTGFLPIGISKSLAEDLGFPIEQVPSRNILWSALPTIVGQVSDIPMRIFDQDLQIEQMYVIDNPQRFVYLSLLMFNSLIMQIDFPRSRLCFLDQGSLDMSEAANTNIRRSASGRVAMQVSVNGGDPLWLELQLEYAGALQLTHAAAVELGFMERDEQATPVGGMLSAVADSLQFGPYELGNIRVAFPAADAPVEGSLQRLARSRRGSGPDISGSLGYDILKHFIITLDNEDGNLHVFVPPN